MCVRSHASLAYLVVKVLESKGDLLTLRDASHTEVEPGAVEVRVLEVGLAITAHPDVELVSLIPAACTRHVA